MIGKLHCCPGQWGDHSSSLSHILVLILHLHQYTKSLAECWELQLCVLEVCRGGICLHFMIYFQMVCEALNWYTFTWSLPLMLFNCSVQFLGADDGELLTLDWTFEKGDWQILIQLSLQLYFYVVACPIPLLYHSTVKILWNMFHSLYLVVWSNKRIYCVVLGLNFGLVAYKASTLPIC